MPSPGRLIPPRPGSAPRPANGITSSVGDLGSSFENRSAGISSAPALGLIGAPPVKRSLSSSLMVNASDGRAMVIPFWMLRNGGAFEVLKAVEVKPLPNGEDVTAGKVVMRGLSLLV